MDAAATVMTMIELLRARPQVVLWITLRCWSYGRGSRPACQRVRLKGHVYLLILVRKGKAYGLLAEMVMTVLIVLAAVVQNLLGKKFTLHHCIISTIN